jgi:pentatricopeptide repeat protein
VGGVGRDADEGTQEMSARIPDARVSVKTFNAMMSAYGNGGQWAKAEPLLARMRAAGVKPDAFTYNALIAALGAGGQWKRAVRQEGAARRSAVTKGQRERSSRSGPCRRARVR